MIESGTISARMLIRKETPSARAMVRRKRATVWRNQSVRPAGCADSSAAFRGR
jgi:hypothetical protein